VSGFLSGQSHLVGWTMLVILRASVLAQDSNAAMLRTTSSGTFVNGSPAPASLALFTNDFIQTQKNAIARIEAPGSAAQIDGETALQFAGDELALDHGSLSVYTTRGMRVRVGCLTVTPVNLSAETLYEVADRDGTLVVHATRSDVYIDAPLNKQKEPQKPSKSGRDLVREGERRSREDGCAVATTKGQTPGLGPILNAPWVKYAGAAAIGGVTWWVLCQDDDPVSPSTPARLSRPIP